MSSGGPDFYRAFEDRFRGSAQDIRARLSVYLPFLRAVARLHPDAGVVDLGCGRGEWLELLRDNEIPAQGVDSDAAMLQACSGRGLRVAQGDALAFLRGLPDASQAAVTAFHVAEHLPIATLHALMQEALRVLRPAGLLVLETPNPESLIVSAIDFHLDPTHGKPLPPRLLGFMAEYHGFTRTHLLRLQQQDFQGDGPSLWSVLAGVSPDYALVAQKAAGALSSPALDDAFARERGTSLYTQAARFDRALADTVHAMDEEVRAIRAVAEQARDIVAEAEKRLVETDRFAREVHAELAELYGSRSWRVTRPLRWAAEFSRRLRGLPGASHEAPPPLPDPLPPAPVPAPAPPPPPADLSPRGLEALQALQTPAPEGASRPPDAS